MKIPNIFFKKISGWVTYPVLFFFSVSVVGTALFFYLPKAIGAGAVIPFEGRVSYIEYNCLCSGSILLYVTPENVQNSASGEVAIMYYWAADLLSRIISEVIDFPLPGENIRAFKNIWTGRLLGNYVPIQVPCVAYIGTGCTVTEESNGILLITGTTLY